MIKENICDQSANSKKQVQKRIQKLIQYKMGPLRLTSRYICSAASFHVTSDTSSFNRAPRIDKSQQKRKNTIKRKRMVFESEDLNQLVQLQQKIRTLVEIKKKNFILEQGKQKIGQKSDNIQRRQISKSMDLTKFVDIFSKTQRLSEKKKFSIQYLNPNNQSKKNKSIGIDKQNHEYYQSLSGSVDYTWDHQKYFKEEGKNIKKYILSDIKLLYDDKKQRTSKIKIKLNHKKIINMQRKFK